MAKKQSPKMEIIRHSLAHIMAAAVQNLYGENIKLGIGPAIENGFYYDFDFGQQTISDQALPKIEKEAQQIINQNLNFRQEKMTITQAKKIFRDDWYKSELLKDIEKYGTSKVKSKKTSQPQGVGCATRPPVSVYYTGKFVDLCRGPHVKNTKELKNVGFKLTKVAGAYWRGDEKNKMLTRIYGVAFATKKELSNHLHQQAEAERRDHRKLGQILELFSFHDEGPGLPFWHHKGLIIRQELIKFWQLEHARDGYIEVSTPIILNVTLWQTSQHMKNYKENMYFSEIDEQKFAIKPMNCPGGLLMYKERPHSYRELPLRVGELGLVHRHERAGVLHGLLRVRCFTQDDAHIYCTAEQIVSELKGVIKLTQRIYKAFGFDYQVELSTRPRKFIGKIKIWDQAESTLKRVLHELKLPFKINPGDGAFYGPKIDFHIKDSIGRTWQCGTLQLDFAQPENFKLEYIDKDGSTKRPVMLHRTIYGSLERFLGILVEHYSGAFPLWLSPIQSLIIPVGRPHIKFARQLKEKIKEFCQELRIMIDESRETVGYKIRRAATQKIPYTIVIGDKEVPARQWSNQTKLVIRQFGKKETYILSLQQFCQRISNEVRQRKNKDISP